MAGDEVQSVCPSCKIVVLDDDSAVSCEGFCGFWYHCGCVDVSESEYEFMKKLGEKSRWLCSPCGLRLDNLVKNTCDFDSIIKLNSTVCKLVEIVKGVVDDNVILNRKIDEVIETTNGLVNVSRHFQQSEPEVDVCNVKEMNTVANSNVILSQAYERSAIQAAERKTTEQEDKNNTVYSLVDIDVDDKNDLEHSIVKPIAENRCVRLSSGLINDPVEVDCKSSSELEGIVVNSDELTWKTVSYKKKSSSSGQSKPEKVGNGTESSVIGLVSKKGKQFGRVPKPVIIGSNTQRGGLKSVDKFKWVFISRCAPDTSVEDIVSYITCDGIEISKSEKLKTKYSDYSSFKVCILDKYFERVLCPDFWPEGVFVKEYDPPRNTFKSTHGPGNFLGKSYR